MRSTKCRRSRNCFQPASGLRKQFWRTPSRELRRFPQISLYRTADCGVYGGRTVNLGHTPLWCERLYQAKAAELILYGRALGLGHSEAEDVLQETFVALLQLSAPPEQPERYGVRTYRNRALNYRRSFWRRVAREFESVRWFERTASESPAASRTS